MFQADFLGGVVEGFYGKAWSQRERLDLIDRLVELGLNTYFYAPKNDLKHRSVWRETYTESELALLRELVDTCNARGVRFLYGLSPGLDIRFSDKADRARIRSRFEQLMHVGMRHFALLFDDVPGDMREVDRGAFGSLAAAQCDVTNEVFAWVREQVTDARFLFCPAAYCDRMDRAQVGGPDYLDDIGRLLSAEIDVLWTGPEIVPASIPVDSIERLTARLRRPPVIWENLFANDYDVRRLFCGPYSGRPRDLRDAVRGILINPNNEYPINFIPLRTFAKFLNGDGEWRPREAYLDAAAEWQPTFESVSGSLPLEDLILLTDCFYLPHEEGPEAQRLLAVCRRVLTEPVDRGGEARKEFSAFNARIQKLFDRLAELRDRDLFDAWSRRIWELKEEMLVIDGAVAAREAGRDIADGAALDNYLPGTFRGGILGQITRLLEMNDEGRIVRAK
jgi:protein O-GlcNAcase / histone acetyltransferase